MDRLKKEWRETQIPQEIRLRARNRAWDKIHRPVFRRRNGVLAFVTCAIALVALLVIFRGGTNEQNMLEEQIMSVSSHAVRQTDSPFDPFVANIASTADVADTADVRNVQDIPVNIQLPKPAVPEIVAARHEEETNFPEIIETASAETVSQEANNVQDRIVLNFILPKSGARLIWIASSNF